MFRDATAINLGLSPPRSRHAPGAAVVVWLPYRYEAPIVEVLTSLATTRPNTTGMPTNLPCLFLIREFGASGRAQHLERYLA